MKREPVLTAAGVASAVAAVMTALVAFGVDLSDDQQKAILGVVAVVAPLLVAAARKYVAPVLDAGERVEGQDEV